MLCHSSSIWDEQVLGNNQTKGTCGGTRYLIEIGYLGMSGPNWVIRPTPDVIFVNHRSPGIREDDLIERDDVSIQIWQVVGC